MRLVRTTQTRIGKTPFPVQPVHTEIIPKWVEAKTAQKERTSRLRNAFGHPWATMKNVFLTNTEIPI